MSIVLMVVFLFAFILDVLRVLTETPTVGEAMVWMFLMAISFTGIMVVYYK